MRVPSSFVQQRGTQVDAAGHGPAGGFNIARVFGGRPHGGGEDVRVTRGIAHGEGHGVEGPDRTNAARAVGAGPVAPPTARTAVPRPVGAMLPASPAPTGRPDPGGGSGDIAQASPRGYEPALRTSHVSRRAAGLYE